MNLNYQLRKACKEGDLNEITCLIEKGANDWNMGMDGAACGGHIDIVKLMIEKGADRWSWGMTGADNNGHIDMVEFFIDKLFFECLFNDNLPRESDYYTLEEYIEFHNEYYHEIVQLLKPFLVDDIVEYVVYDYLKI